MSMHLHHPSLSLNGKKKGKQKFRNAEQARAARELEKSWADLKKKWEVESEEKKRTRALKAPVMTVDKSALYIRDTGPRIPSLNGGRDMAPAPSAPTKVYTGDKVIGIAVMHKSCLQPVFNEQAAKDAASMRR